MTSFKESVIIPLSIFKNCNYSDKAPTLNTSIPHKESPILARQRELLHERMFNRKPYHVYTTSSETETESVKRIGIPISTILSHIIISQRPNINSILEHMIANDLLWNKKGEIILKDKTIKDSNIIEIMKYFSKTTNFQGEPTGVNEFWKSLNESYIPKSWIKVKPLISRPQVPLQAAHYPLEKSAKVGVASALKKGLEKGDSISDEEFYDVETNQAGNISIGPIKRIPPSPFSSSHTAGRGDNPTGSNWTRESNLTSNTASYGPPQGGFIPLTPTSGAVSKSNMRTPEKVSLMPEEESTSKKKKRKKKDIFSEQSTSEKSSKPRDLLKINKKVTKTRHGRVVKEPSRWEPWNT